MILFLKSLIIHGAFEQIQFSIPVLKEVMRVQREPYPNEIYYNTYMNRYRKAYWIEIHSITPGTLYAKTHAWIAERVGGVVSLPVEA